MSKTTVTVSTFISFVTYSTILVVLQIKKNNRKLDYLINYSALVAPLINYTLRFSELSINHVYNNSLKGYTGMVLKEIGVNAQNRELTCLEKYLFEIYTISGNTIFLHLIKNVTSNDKIDIYYETLSGYEMLIFCINNNSALKKIIIAEPHLKIDYLLNEFSESESLYLIDETRSPLGDIREYIINNKKFVFRAGLIKGILDSLKQQELLNVKIIK